MGNGTETSIRAGVEVQVSFEERFEEMGPCLSHVAFALDEIEHRKYDRWMDNDGKPYFYSRSTGECTWDMPESWPESDPEEKWMPTVRPLLFPFEGYEFSSDEMNKRDQAKQREVRNYIFKLLLVFLSALDEMRFFIYIYMLNMYMNFFLFDTLTKFIFGIFDVYNCPQALEQLEYDWQSMVSVAKKDEKGEEKQQQVEKQQEDGKEVTEEKETTR